MSMSDKIPVPTYQEVLDHWAHGGWWQMDQTDPPVAAAHNQWARPVPARWAMQIKPHGNEIWIMAHGVPLHRILPEHADDNSTIFTPISMERAEEIRTPKIGGPGTWTIEILDQDETL